jgi:hypothetical protein
MASLLKMVWIFSKVLKKLPHLVEAAFLLLRSDRFYDLLSCLIRSECAQPLLFAGQ